MLNAGHIKPELHDYMASHSSPPDPVLQELSRETAARYPHQAHMQVDPVQGSLLTVLTRAVKAQLAIEVGTFTGYSSICLARGLAAGGKLICCDINEEWTSLAREYWQKAGLADRIELRLGPALDTLRALPAGATFDLAFIDADKRGYRGYWEELVPRMRPGGILLIDNTLLHGRIFEESLDPDARAIKEFNDHVLNDDRVELVMLAVGDGLTLARVK
jgi:caffeoyl-CoA O-methyltransferase